MKKASRIYIAGHRGMVGSAILRKLKEKGYKNIVGIPHEQLDLTRQKQVEDFFDKEQPAYVFMAAARVGGIQANINSPADFMYDNLMIQNNIIRQCCLTRVKKLLFLGSSCIYPRECPQPMKEEYLLTGPLEPTNEGYALAKISGLKLTEYCHRQYGLIVVNPMPCNLYGPNDSFDLQNSHVLSGLTRRFVDSVDEGLTEIELWGSGIARREFLHVDDVAEACLFLMEHFDEPEPINVGWGKDISIKELARMVAGQTGFRGDIKWDTTKPDGMIRKCLDVSKISALGFAPKISLEEGVSFMIQYYKRLKANNH